MSLLLKKKKKKSFSITLSFYFPPVHSIELCNMGAPITVKRNRREQFLGSIREQPLRCRPAACSELGRGIFPESEPQVSVQ